MEDTTMYIQLEESKGNLIAVPIRTVLLYSPPSPPPPPPPPPPQGYTIPLDKRLAADGRGLQDHTINDNFAKLAQSLYTADREVGHLECVGM